MSLPGYSPRGSPGDPSPYRSPGSSPGSLKSTEGSPGYETDKIKKYRDSYQNPKAKYGFDVHTFENLEDYPAAREIVDSMKGKTSTMLFGFPEDASMYVSALTAVYYQEMVQRGEAIKNPCIELLNPKHPSYKEANIKAAIQAQLEFQKIEINQKQKARTCRRVFEELHDVYWKIIKGMQGRVSNPRDAATKARIKDIILESSGGNLLPLHIKERAYYSYLSQWEHGGGRRRTRRSKKPTRKARKAHKKSRGRRRH